MKNIQKKIFKYIKKGMETNFQSLTNEIENDQIMNDKNEFRSFLHLIIRISNNNRSQNFHVKIEQILSFYKNQILNYFTNDEIFDIFKNNKRILLFLFDEKIIIFTESILQKISKKKYIKSNYIQFLLPEINSFTKRSEETSGETDLKLFKEKRKIGENELYMCELIRNDSVEDFITLINRKNISLNTKIEASIYETNTFLIKNTEQSLIEYAAFFGSIQIFQYLLLNNVTLTPSLWKYAIHGRNADLIHLLEDNHVECNIDQNIIESIKCHHNELVNYFLNMTQNNIQSYISVILKYYNFEYFDYKFINEKLFYDYCKNDYIIFVQKFLPDVIINEVVEIRKELDSNIYTLKIKNMTALHVAIEKENIEIIKLLLTRKDIDVNCLAIIFKGPKLHQKTALHIAVENENAEIVKLLLSNQNIDVNYIMISSILSRHGSTQHMTALYIAVGNDDIEIAYILCLYQHTDVNIPYKKTCDSGEQCIPSKTLTLEEKTPYQLATELNNQTICQILLMKHLLPN